MSKLLRGFKRFVKRNAYPISLFVCMLLLVTLVSVSVISFNDQGLVVNENAEKVTVDSSIVFVSPIKDGKISKEYAEDHLLEDKTTGYWQTHQAIDYKASEGAEVLAIYDGVVSNVEHSMMDGLVVTITHSNNLKSVYKCLSEDEKVNKGEKVSAGQVIGTVGTNLTEKADGAHLHLELYEDNKLIDPEPYFTEIGK